MDYRRALTTIKARCVRIVLYCKEALKAEDSLNTMFVEETDVRVIIFALPYDDRADMAMYAAKAAGRNRMCAWKP